MNRPVIRGLYVHSKIEDRKYVKDGIEKQFTAISHLFSVGKNDTLKLREFLPFGKASDSYIMPFTKGMSYDLSLNKFEVDRENDILTGTLASSMPVAPGESAA